MKKLIYILTIISLFQLTSCEPGMEGELRVFNESNQILTLKYCSDSQVQGSPRCDTITQVISPNSDIVIKVFRARQRAKAFYCCPCEIDIHSIKSISGDIKKDPTNSDNWSISNKNKLRNRANGSTAKCEFHISTGDL